MSYYEWPTVDPEFEVDWPTVDPEFEVKISLFKEIKRKRAKICEECPKSCLLTSVSETIIAFLLTYLPHDDVSVCQRVNRAFRRLSQQALLTSRDFSLWDCDRGTWRYIGMMRLLQKMKKLKSLELLWCDLQTSTSLVMEHSYTLQTLRITNPHVLSYRELRDDRILDLIGSNCPNLVTLTLWCCFTPDELVNVDLPKLQNLELIQVLSIDYSNKRGKHVKPTEDQLDAEHEHQGDMACRLRSFRPSHFEQFAKRVPNLRDLSMDMLRPAFLEAMAYSVPHLKRLDMRHWRYPVWQDRFDETMAVLVRSDMFPDLESIVVGLPLTYEQAGCLMKVKPGCNVQLFQNRLADMFLI